MYIYVLIYIILVSLIFSSDKTRYEIRSYKIPDNHSSGIHTEVRKRKTVITKFFPL